MAFIYAAPLQSYTTVFHRYAWAKEFKGIDKFFTPFFEQHQPVGYAPRLLPDLDQVLNDGLFVVPQVLSDTSAFLLQFARDVEALGYNEINLNMGCPHPPITHKGLGGGLIKRSDVLDKMLDEFFDEKLEIKLSVKMRIGIDDVNQWQPVVGVLNQYPLEEVIVHPRTVKQQYKGEPHWSVFGDVFSELKHPVVLNGDIVSPQNAEVLLSQYSDAKGLMIGRGWLFNPALPEEILGISHADDLKTRIVRFHQYFYEAVEMHVKDINVKRNLLHGFWQYLSEQFDDGKRWNRRLVKDKGLQSYSVMVRELTR